MMDRWDRSTDDADVDKRSTSMVWLTSDVRNGRGFLGDGQIFHGLHLVPRRFPHNLIVHDVGHIPNKTELLDNMFGVYAFSFILKGEGDYHVGGRHWPVRAPCVLTQRPGEIFRYGPTRTWEELYIVYPPEAGEDLRRVGFIDPVKPIWYVTDPAPILAAVAEMASLRGRAEQNGVADHLDRLCEFMIFQSLRHATGQQPDERELAVTAIRALVEERWLDAHDFDHLARRHGLTPATFRRLWQRAVGLPPARYIIQVRLRRACRMLVETDEPVAVIATRVGFTDPLYFSRRFGAAMGITASGYRRRHRHRQP